VPAYAAELAVGGELDGQTFRHDGVENARTSEDVRGGDDDGELAALYVSGQPLCGLKGTEGDQATVEGDECRYDSDVLGAVFQRDTDAGTAIDAFRAEQQLERASQLAHLAPRPPDIIEFNGIRTCRRVAEHLRQPPSNTHVAPSRTRISI
jgi:hypothetical protein